MGEYLAAVAIVFGVNLLPAFGPPTWSVLIILQGSLALDPVLLVPLGALAATSGRVVLALASRQARGRLSAQRLAGLDALRSELTGNPRRSAAGLGLFLISPLPSAQLFVGAGVLRAPLPPLAAAFLLGRLVSYSIYVGAATVATRDLLRHLGRQPALAARDHLAAADAGRARGPGPDRLAAAAPGRLRTTSRG
jgi:uncharacterized membrane protein YdjX (TVP38/TMEM64 family)